jgi:hypothetical protein
MTPDESAPDKELLDRYRRASDTEAIAPSEATRAAILAEARRVAEQRATEPPPPAVDTSRPAANDSRWKMTVFGTAGAALLAALLFAPRYWESVPAARLSSAPAAPAANTPAAQSEAKSAASDAAAPAMDAPPAPSRESTSLQEIVVTQATPKKPSAPAPKLEEIKPLEPEQANAVTQSAARQNYAQAAPPAPSVSALAATADRTARARGALTPATLQLAAALGDTTQTTALLDQGVAVDARDELGRTPLMLAVMQNRLTVVRLLLARGADPNAADNAGRTPLQLAKQENLRDVATLLEGAGARAR